jgi:hypothetical protein
MAAHPAGAPSDSDAFEQRIRKRELLNSGPLDTIPDPSSAKPHGNIPNTPLAASTISFLLGSTFTFGLLIFLSGGISSYWFATHQLGFFMASWSAFHWGEFAVTVGWNRERASVDCKHFRSWHLCLLTKSFQLFFSIMVGCITWPISSRSQNISWSRTSDLRSSHSRTYPHLVCYKSLLWAARVMNPGFH